jgi:hypothetical protein
LSTGMNHHTLSFPLISLIIHWSFKSELFSLHVWVFFVVSLITGFHCALIFLNAFFWDGTLVWTQGFMLTKQVFYHLSHTSSLNFALSNMSIATLVCTWVPFAWKIFFHPFTLSLYLSLPVISCKQQICHSIFFNDLLQKQSMSFDYRIETTDIQSYYLKICRNPCHFVIFVAFDSSLFSFDNLLI